MKSIAEARIKRQRALELAAEGMSYEEIALNVGYRQRGSAHRAVFKALADHEVESADQLRAIECARLDRLQAAIWDRAMAGDCRAVDSALRIIDQRSRLLGLYPTRSSSPSTKERPVHLVVGHIEGNPREATMEDVYRWSARPDTASQGSTECGSADAC